LKPIAWSGAIGVSGEASEDWVIGNRQLDIRCIAMVNDTRPTADPRPCFASVRRSGATEGMEIAVGRTSSYNDFIKTYPAGFTVGPEDTVHFSIYGENLDTYKINVLYQVIQLG
jgi:hypothetical protein